MKEINSIIGHNLKKIRKDKELSLDKVTEMTGVSKAMLGQIERGESNPTVATLWKIATGLKVSFSSFLEENHNGRELSLVSYAEIDPIIEEEGKMIIYPLFFFDANRGFEIFTIQLNPGCNHVSEPHDNGIEEYIIVREGTVEITVDENTYKLEKGDAIRFYANKKHIYRNMSGKQAYIENIIYYFWPVNR
jgi:transcriptional regulator with XRE-family HTH domain